MRTTRRALAVIGAGLGGMVLAAAGVTPQSADSNIAVWLRHVGFAHPPTALASKSADHAAQIGAALVIIVCACVFFDLLPHFRRSPKHETPVGEALAFLGSGKWGRSLDQALQDVFEPGTPNVFNWLRQAASQGRITVWGRHDRNDIYREIEPKYWLTHQLDGQALVTNGFARTWGDDGDSYIDLVVSKAEMRRMRKNG